MQENIQKNETFNFWHSKINNSKIYSHLSLIRIKAKFTTKYKFDNSKIDETYAFWMAYTWLNGTLFRKINKLGHFSCRNGFTTCASSTLSMHLSQQMIWNGQKMVLLYNLRNLDTIINNFSKFYGKVGVISWFLFRLIWKNYVLYQDFDLKSWIVYFLTCFTREKIKKHHKTTFSVKISV